MGLSEIILGVAAALGVIIGVFIGGLRGQRKGREQEKKDAKVRESEAVQKGRDAVARNRGGDPDERVRNNDDKWGMR
jgi:hypothetical protein